jgi:hypothetical protein
VISIDTNQANDRDDIKLWNQVLKSF